jgi:tetratricopeptide (TPR) repeat protein
MNRLSEAIEDYTVAILYYPEYGMAWFNRAIVNHRLGYLKEACTDVQRAEALDVQGTDRLRKVVCGE